MFFGLQPYLTIAYYCYTYTHIDHINPSWPICQPPYRVVPRRGTSGAVVSWTKFQGSTGYPRIDTLHGLLDTA